MHRERQALYGGTVDVYAATGYPNSANDQAQRCLWPANEVDLTGTRWIEFVLYLQSVAGTPTAASLTARFQKGVGQTTGNEWVAPKWADFTDYDVASRCLSGLGWGGVDGATGTVYPRALDKTPGTLHDTARNGASLTLGYEVRCRVIEPPDRLRVVLTPTFTGGSNPAYRINGYYTREFAG